MPVSSEPVRARNVPIVNDYAFVYVRRSDGRYTVVGKYGRQWLEQGTYDDQAEAYRNCRKLAFRLSPQYPAHRGRKKEDE